MNGKHPIDDLFARGLRDAEATPPPGVWEGIVRERAKAPSAPAKGSVMTRNRGRWGLAAILLLLLSAGAYWLVVQPGTNSADGPASVEPSPGGEGQPSTLATKNATTESGSATPEKSNAEGPSTTSTTSAQEPDATPSSTGTTTDPTVKQAGTPHGSPVGSAGDSNTKKPVTQQAARSNKPASQPATVATVSSQVNDDARNNDEPANENTTRSSPNDEPAIAPSSESSATSKGKNGDPVSIGGSTSMAQASSGTVVRTSPDVHLSKLDGLVTPLVGTAVTPPGPLLQGDSTPVYVLDKGQWWFGVQAGISSLNGEWRGTGPEISELNESETWQGGQSLALAVGRDWLSGWSSGITIGMAKKRSRFLHHESEPGHVETVIDTTWTNTPMGTQTNYSTWDIVERLVEEPGVERDYSATNTYTSLRIAPEIGYRIAGRQRFSLHARGGLAVSMTLGRKGSALVSSATSDSTEVVQTSITPLALNDASLDDRFPVSFAVFASVELRYRLCERWSLSMLPMFNFDLSRSAERVPQTSMTEVGGALRLRYDLGHKERRVK